MQVIVPWASRSHPSRSHPLSLVLAYYADSFPGWPCRLSITEGDEFPRALAINRAAVESDADVLVFNDADSIVPPDQLVQAVDLAAVGRAVRAYDVYRRIGQADTAGCERWPDVFSYSPVWEQANTMSQGVYAIPRDVFLDAGGYDPRFRYFYDDCSFDLVLTELGMPQQRVPGPLYHLWHEPRETFEEDEELWARYRGGPATVVRAEHEGYV